MTCPSCRGHVESMSDAYGVPDVGTVVLCMTCGELVALSATRTLRPVHGDERRFLPAWLRKMQLDSVALIATLWVKQ